ncbi:MAG: DUF3604 domain-containing protein [Candidatus Lernaella stagnicola]|nr:DUF3604 domain-containing protein [Candidatus Lernaella stagnicola]
MKNKAWPLIWLILAATIFACSPPPQPGGVAFISATGPVEAGAPTQWEVIYRAPEQMPAGAQVRILFPHPYYSNRPPNVLPQIRNPKEDGYCALYVDGKPTPLNVAETALYPRHLIANARSGGWDKGAELRFLLGEGKTFRFPHAASKNFAPFVLVDLRGDGDLQKAPAKGVVDIGPGPATTMRLTAPAWMAVGEPFGVTLTHFDRFGNPTARVTGPPPKLEIAGGETAAGRDFPPVNDAGFRRIDNVTLDRPGVYRFVAAFASEPNDKVVSNPLRVEENPARRLLFGDPHGHSTISDGAQSADTFYETARGAAALDFAALTDHEWQIDPGEWADMQIHCRKFATPRFTALLAWEYSLGGHGIVYYPTCDATPPIGEGGTRELWRVALGRGRAASWQRLGSGFRLDFGFKPALWETLRTTDAFFVPHTSATTDMGDEADQDDGERIPLYEVYSGHGSNFSAADPDRVPNFASSGSIVRLLNNGRRFGLIAGSDSHDTRPGIATWGRAPPGLTAVWAATRGRTDLIEAMRQRHTYATTGHRSIIEFTANGEPMGSRLITAAPVHLGWNIIGDGKLKHLEIWRNGVVWRTTELKDVLDATGETVDSDHLGPCWYLLVVHLTDGGRAWTSPVYVDDPRTLQLDKFAATDVGGVNEIVIHGKAGTGTRKLTLLRQHGDDGMPGHVGYEPVGEFDLDAGQVNYREPFSIAPGLTTYYLIEERNEKGVFRHGPVALVRYPGAEFVGGNFRFFAWRRGSAANVYIRDLDGRIVRTLHLPLGQKGLIPITWDGKDESGHAVRSLAFFQVHEGDRRTRWRALVRPPEEEGVL